MKRRDIIKYTSYATGAALSMPLITTILSGCNTAVTKKRNGEGLHFFTDEEFKMISSLVDVILPKTDSPSATEVGVHNMIDHMVGTIYNQEQQKEYKEGFMTLSGYLNQLDNDTFLKMPESQKIEALQSLINSKNDQLKASQHALMAIKQQTLAYYLSTEEIGTKFLNYLPVPGAYEACISLEEAGGKAWAL